MERTENDESYTMRCLLVQNGANILLYPVGSPDVQSRTSAGPQDSPKNLATALLSSVVHLKIQSHGLNDVQVVPVSFCYWLKF